MWIFGFSHGVSPTELRNLVSSLEYLVSNGRQVLLGGIRLGGSATSPDIQAPMGCCKFKEYQQGRLGTFMAEPPNLMPPRSARLTLDTKHSGENIKLLGSVGHTPEENPKIHIFAIRITNERIKLTSFLTISYITFNTTSEYNIY